MAVYEDVHEPSAVTTTFEDYLGPSDQRYFGGGYRRTRYELMDLRLLGALPEARFGAKAAVRYATDWSVKGTSTRQPHLSTVDALVLVSAIAEEILQRCCGLSATEIQTAWFADLSIRAGARPTIDLEDVAVHGGLVAQQRESVREQVSTLRIEVGTFKCDARVVHSVPNHAIGKSFRSADSPYGSAFRHSIHRSRVLETSSDKSSLTCLHEVRGGRGAAERLSGLESAYHPQPTLIDSLVLAGQMMQVLLARSQGATRSSTGNLWMRRIVFSCRSPWRPSDSRARLAVVGRRDIVRDRSVLHGIEARCENVCGVDLSAGLAYTVASE